jgi:hypothetical protein
MSWDKKQRGGANRYYYRSVRTGTKVTKIYFGRGPLAELAARLYEAVHEKRRAARQTWLAEQVQLAEAGRLLQELRTLTKLLTTATLVVNGYHLHHGEWRRRRYETTAQNRTSRTRTQTPATQRRTG